MLADLKRRYFAVIRLENYPHTPKVTRWLDRAETLVRKLQKKIES